MTITGIDLKPTATWPPAFYMENKRGRPAKILLIPPITDSNAGERNWGAPNLGCHRLSAWLRHHGHETEIWDCNIDTDLDSKLKSQKWDIVGFSVLQDTLHNDIKAMWKAKRYCVGSMLVAGGIEATMNFQDIFDASPIRLIVLAEGEWQLLALANGVRPEDIDGIVYKKEVPNIPQDQYQAWWETVDFTKMPYDKYWKQMLDKHLIDYNEQGGNTVRIVDESHCNRNCSYCLTEDSMLLTTNGINTIKEIVDKKQDAPIFTFDHTWERPIAFSKRHYHGPMIKVKTQYNNFPLTGTPEHKIKVWREGKIIDVMLKDVVRMDRLMVPMLRTVTPKNPYLEVHELLNDVLIENGRAKYKWGKTSIPSKIPITTELCRLFGYYLSEGCVSISKTRPNSSYISFTFNSKEMKYVKEVHDSLKNIFGIDSYINKNGSALNISTGCNILARLFVSLFGKGARNKMIPQFVLEWPVEWIRELVCGWLRGDGTKDCRGSTVSPHLAFHMWLLMLKLDLGAKLQRNGPTKNIIQGRKVNVAENWYEISLVQDAKGTAFGKFVHGDSYHTNRSERFSTKTPFQMGTCRWCGNTPLVRRGKRNGIQMWTCRKCKRASIEHSMYEIEWSKDKKYALIPVRGAEIIENFDGEVYNVEIENAHTYVVNGISSENCSVTLYHGASHGKLIKPMMLSADALHELVKKIVKQQPGVKTVYFVSDDFCQNRDRVRNFFKKIIAEGPHLRFQIQTFSFYMMKADGSGPDTEFIELLAKGGVRHVTMGVENSCLHCLLSFHKPQKIELIPALIKECLRVGIKPYLLNILFPPAAKIECLWKNYKTLCEWRDLGATLSAEPNVMVYRGAPIAQSDHVMIYKLRDVGEGHSIRTPLAIISDDPKVRWVQRRFNERRESYLAERKLAHGFKGSTGPLLVDLLGEVLEEHKKLGEPGVEGLGIHKWIWNGVEHEVRS